MQKTKTTGLVADMWTHIRVLQIAGHWLLDINKSSSSLWNYMRVAGTGVQSVLLVMNYVFMIVNCTLQTADSDEFTSNVATILFFTHCVFKLIYCGMRSKKFYRILNSWNNSNSHPLFAESSARHHANATSGMKRLLTIVLTCTLTSAFAWTTITFFGDSIIHVKDPENENNTLIEEVPRLMIRAWYPWDTTNSFMYVVTFVYQFFWLVSMLVLCNLLDTLFCSWLIYACEQLVHLKEIMKPLMEISHSMDSLMPQPADLFRAASSSSHAALLSGSADALDANVRGIYNSASEYSGFRQGVGTLATVQGSSMGPNGLTKKQELLIRSAIKYWVERHKQVVRYVSDIGDTYGGALLAHMLISTVELTLLAYLATTITGLSPRGMCIIGYVIYSFGQVFQFCYYGNHLIEESSSVLEAAYSCRWYDGTDEAKAFVQIICQQCQKSMTISGAKFFTVSLDLFASILGAVVTYFLLLIQLN